MNDDIINFCENNNFESDTIREILNYQNNPKIKKNLMETLPLVYNMLQYAGYNIDEIDKIIKYNCGMLLMSKEEIMKFAYVLSIVEPGEKIYNSRYTAKNIRNYKRIFMRYIIGQKAGYSGVGNYYLVDGTKEDVYGKLNFTYLIFRATGVRNVDSDEKLEKVLNEVLLYNGKHITVDEYITKMSQKYYLKYLQYKSIKEKNGKSI